MFVRDPFNEFYKKETNTKRFVYTFVVPGNERKSMSYIKKTYSRLQ